MAAQSELTCVSCGTDFDPAETGGFCPDCDTPHPDYEREGPADDEAEDAAEADADAEAAEEEPEDTEAEIAEADVEADEAADDVEEVEIDESEDELDEAEADVEAEDDADEPTEAEAETDAAEAEADAAEADADEAAAAAEAGLVECSNCGEEVDPDFEFCPNCGDDLEAVEESPDLDTCPDCSEDVDESMSFCPNCGHDLDAARDELGGEESSVPDEVTLLVNGEAYTFGDGDTFGRQDESWLADLVEAAGGRDEVAYISGEHLTFSVEDDGVYVTDTSANGTLLNGDDLDGDTAKLSDGDVIELADRAEVEVGF